MRGSSNTSSPLSSPLRSLSATRASGPASPSQYPISPGLSSFSTINRAPSVSPGANDSNVTQSGSTNGVGIDGLNHSPDLNQEVAALSNKLIKSINHQTALDDSLANTKHELELSKARIKQLEAVAKEHADMMAKGLLVDKKDVDTEHEQFMRRLREERSQRNKAEKDKKTIEQELEHLTTALFEEANKMVAAARRERDAMDRKNEQLRAQIQDTEVLLVSHQEQLAELKSVLQQMTVEREEAELNISTPSTPGLGNRSSKESLGRMFDAMSMAVSHAGSEEVSPTNPLSLPHLIQPVLRYDTGSYHDFCSMLRISKLLNSAPPSSSSGMGRLSSGSLTSFQVMGMGMSISSYSSPNQSPTSGLNGSSPSTPVSGSTNTPVSLKDTRFYKRALVEDIEPTLRLDTAPGLSWLARRNVLAAITDGSLVVDPILASSQLHLSPCSLCGETQNDELHARTHRMRIAETETAQKYALCGYCVGRIRATCDFLAFLRTVKDGLWKYDTEEDERHAWEEAVKFRDRMFWSRIGGGVVPAHVQPHRGGSQRSSVEQSRNFIHHPFQQHQQQQQQLRQQRQIRAPPVLTSPPRTPTTAAPPVPPKGDDNHKVEEKKDSSYLTPIKKLGFGRFGFGDSNKTLPPPTLETSLGPGGQSETSALEVKDLDKEKAELESQPVLEVKVTEADGEVEEPRAGTLAPSPEIVPAAFIATPVVEPAAPEPKTDEKEEPVQRPESERTASERAPSLAPSLPTIPGAW